jgi:hypothetical protein
MITFPHANGLQIADGVFVACWHALFGKEQRCVARLHTRDSFNQILARPCHRESLEYLCRMLVPVPYRNTCQATEPFMAANQHLLRHCQATSPCSGQSVHGAELISHVDLSPTSEEDTEAEAILESLEEADYSLEVETRVAAPPLPTVSALATWVNCFVDQVHAAPFQPMYRGKPHGPVVRGWPARLGTYFWPNPATSAAAVTTTVSGIVARLQPLVTAASAGTAWTPAEDALAVTLANEIFKWGRVPQDPATVTPQAIRDVILSATSKSRAGTPPMNSGWTKVAAFASDHLEGSTVTWPEVIWDSRVATSVISRLDRCLEAANLPAVPPALAGIGRVDTGRGGTRPRNCTLRWPDGYRSWPAQFAGSRFVALVRDKLNSNPAKYGTMPELGSPSSGNGGKWTVRGVEMVLFMDGY